MERLMQEKQLDEASGFVKDEFYEGIQAPKWMDFDLPEEPVDDHEWFCRRAGCPHEKMPFDEEGEPQSTCAMKKEPQMVSLQVASYTLQTIPEEMVMSHHQMTDRDAANTTAILHLSPTFAQRLKISCDSFTHPLLATFLCCFP
ncbi:hypothetical protein GOP47_0029435 [Adiantum capillus-veneris]|nr:hypothetical protein GOP47_0029435 [Adiantum capillus-veneris]